MREHDEFGCEQTTMLLRLLGRPHTRLEGILLLQPSLMSEKGQEPDVRPRHVNVARVP